MRSASEGWIATLDQLEAGVERIEDELGVEGDGEIGRVDLWTPPGDLGPLPQELRQRATSLSWRMAAVEQRTRERRDALQAELDEIDKRRGAGAAYAAAGPAFAHTEYDVLVPDGGSD